MVEKSKRRPAAYRVDFVTALPLDACHDRLARGVVLPAQGLGAQLAPITQRVIMVDDRTFVAVRTFPGALYPLRFVGHLDPDEARGGTWVHGAITHDAYNQVLIEGLIAFALFFLITALLFLRLRTRALAISLPTLLLMLTLFSLRWQALHAATEDLAHWVRRRLYVTGEQAGRG